MPPPPCCTARPFHSAGSHTRKLIGLAVADVSTGAITPSTSQRAGDVCAAGSHRGAAIVTAEIGKPMALTGIVVPTLEAEQSASAIVFAFGRVWRTGACGRIAANAGRQQSTTSRKRRVIQLWELIVTTATEIAL